MIKVYDKEHKHHALWKQLMQNLLDGKEPLLVELKYSDGVVELAHLDHNGMPACIWSENVNYHIVPKKKDLVVNGKVFRFPLPASFVEDGQLYWLATIMGADVYRNILQSTTDEHLKMGIVHLTEEAAKEHSEVLKKICKF